MVIIALLERSGEERRIYLFKIDGRDEPNLTQIESLSQGKTRPDFLKSARWFGAKIVPPRMPHGMSECLEIGPALNPASSITRTAQPGSCTSTTK